MSQPGVRLIFALHNHQPVGNFDGVFEAAYLSSYEPFLGVMESYPEIPFVLHTSGPLMEWLAERKPDYIRRVRTLVETGRVEILGGPFYEPILTMIPQRDRVGQIRAYGDYLEELLGTRPRGAWVPERVWEQHLVSALVEAGIEYTVLDDFHFERAGLTHDELLGYYVTEDEGKLLKIFPGSERMRYMTPFQEPHASYEFLRRVATEHPGATVVCADDGEKFGSWPKTFDHVFTNAWLRRFCDMIQGNQTWLKPTTFGEAVDSTLPIGKIYLPDGSYREMSEWVLPGKRLQELKEARKQAESIPHAERLQSFTRLGGFWRNFKTRYPETDEMYTRMLGLSKRLEREEARPGADPDYIEVARQELYRGQCNCAYWHGSFGGLYLPHLRNAIYRHLIAAHNAIDDSEEKTGPRVSLEVADFNLDLRQEVKIENDLLVAFIRPAMGGQIYEFDVRHALVNILNTLDRRPEIYHDTIAAMLRQDHSSHESGRDHMVLKQGGMEERLVYDTYPRKALVDHFLPLDVTLADLVACRNRELGDFTNGAYLSKVQRSADRVLLSMDRIGMADGNLVRIHKSIELEAGSPSLVVQYILEDLPVGIPLHFAIEINVAAMAGHVDNRYFSDARGSRLGMLDSELDLSGQDGISFSDEWLDLEVDLGWTRSANLWAFPVQTVSQSEGGYECVYQSSAVIPHWVVIADESRRWEVRLRWTVGRVSESTTKPRAGLRSELLKLGQEA